MRPMYSHMKKDISFYIDRQYLPEGYQDGLRLQDTSRLPKDMVRKWVKLIQDRQRLYEEGHITSIFAWNVVEGSDDEDQPSKPSRRRKGAGDGVADPVRSTPAVADTKRKGKGTQKAKANQKRKERSKSSGSSEEEIENGSDTSEDSFTTLESGSASGDDDSNASNINGDDDAQSDRSAYSLARAARAILAKDNSPPAVADSDVELDEDKEEISVDDESPATAVNKMSRIPFLQSLCDQETYVDLVYWLDESMVSYSSDLL